MNPSHGCVGGGPGFTRVIVSIDLTCEQKLILSILLYGCESWCLTEELLHRLRVFHAQCLRAMSREGHAGKHTWEQHISSEQLMQELGLDAIDFYVARRQLRWLGHVSRMDWERLPRRMLSAWAPHARGRGGRAAAYTYGRSMAKAMDVFNLDHACRPELAADWARWRTMLQSGEAPPPFQQPPAPAPPMLISHPLVRPGVLRRCALTPPLTRRCEPRRRLRVSAKLRRPGKRCPHAHPPLALRFRNALI